MIGIITAVPTERDAVLEKATNIKPFTIYEIEFYEGLIHHTPCIIAMSGVGKVNAARCTQLMIDKFGPGKIVNIGSAGALHPDLNIGDVIISTSCIQHDVDLTVFGLKKGSFGGLENGFIKADTYFAKHCETAMQKSIGGEFKIYSGPIATGDQFNDSPEKKAQLYEEFGAYCNEMEGGAIAQVCAACQIPFVVIRSISDKPEPDQDSKLMYHNFKDLAAQRCASFLVNLIAVLEKADLKEASIL